MRGLGEEELFLIYKGLLFLRSGVSEIIRLNLCAKCWLTERTFVVHFHPPAAPQTELAALAVSAAQSEPPFVAAADSSFSAVLAAGAACSEGFSAELE